MSKGKPIFATMAMDAGILYEMIGGGACLWGIYDLENADLSAHCHK